MPSLLAIIVLIFIGAWGWNKYGDDVTIIWKSSKSVVQTSSKEIGKAKEKIGKALSIFDKLDLGEKENESTSTNHRKTKQE